MDQKSYWKNLLTHLGIILAISVGLVLGFFYIYLPISTNHGETVSVPDARGIPVDELDDFLGSRNLRYEVTEDSGYSATEKPLAVLKQFPLPGAKVKENRKIYVTLNSEKAPMIRMPKLTGGSVKNATLILKTYDLQFGEVIYVPDPHLNYIFKQQINGREVMEGEKIPKGSTIDLVAGDGLGKQTLEAPNLTGHDLESAKVAILGSGLRIGEIKQDTIDYAVLNEKEDQIMSISPGAIFKQNPTAGSNMRLGQKMDLWVYRTDSVSQSPTLLDNN